MNYFCKMISPEEETFLKYWEENRVARSSFTNKILGGLPMAVVFCLPILLLIVSVYLFFPDWYTKISGTSPATFFVVIIAVFIATLFYAFIRMHFKWEMNEQLYKELKFKQKKQHAANQQ